MNNTPFRTSRLALSMALLLPLSALAQAMPESNPTGNAMSKGTMAGHDMPAMKDPMVGGAAMSPERDIIDNAMKSKDHTTLVSAVKAAGLVDTLKGPGPFTVFAPTNEAFSALPAGTVDTLLKPENKADLVKELTYHVVPGKIDAAGLESMALQNGGVATLKTVQGEDLSVMKSGNQWQVKDAKGNVATITIANVYQSNGVIFVIDKVLMP